MFLLAKFSSNAKKNWGCDVYKGFFEILNFFFKSRVFELGSVNVECMFLPITKQQHDYKYKNNYCPTNLLAKVV
jgi:hypothetical protein